MDMEVYEYRVDIWMAVGVSIASYGLPERVVKSVNVGAWRQEPVEQFQGSVSSTFRSMLCVIAFRSLAVNRSLWELVSQVNQQVAGFIPE
jgi:hypothetical protein